MADIQCPSCGTMNPAGQELCQICQAPLESADSFQPGQAPTKKVTAELEPILPQWLRDARSQARKSAEEQTGDVGDQSLDKSNSPIDLLAGLQAQSGDDDDEIPDWLGNITGKSGKGKKVQPGGSTEIRRVELGGGTEELKFPGASIPAAQAPVPSADENELPPWLAASISGIQDDSRQDTLTGWLQNNTEVPAPDVEKPSAAAASSEDEPGAGAVDPFSFFESPSASNESNTDRLNKLSVEQSPAIRRPEGYAPLEAGLPDWLKGQSGGPGPTRLPDTGELPDWLSKLDTAPLQPLAEQPEPAAPASPGWLNPSDGSPAESVSFPPAASISDTPDWLQNLDPEAPSTFPASPSAEAAPALSADTPDWLKSLGSETADAFPSSIESSKRASAEPAADVPLETSGWLKHLGAETPAPSSTFTPDLKSEPAGPADELLGGSPDWLKDLGTHEPADYSSPTPASVQSESSASFISSDPIPPQTADRSSPAFSQTTGDNVFSRESLSKGDLDALFTDMPDWLAATGAEEPGLAPAAESLNIIAPGSLPSWVEAMRPVESSAAQGGPVGDQSLETRGPLAGLQGVLPAVPFLGPSSKPKAYSLKLIASTEQQSHAALLEEVLAVETIPVPISSARVVATQRMLRLGIASLLFFVLAVTVFAGTQLFPLPLSTNISPEVQSGLESIWALPENAAVLVVFDYEPALAGEMQTLAAPLLDQMILLRHPRLTLLSTSPTGATLAERLFSGPLASHNYQRGVQFLNLGYLPGGLSGVRAFAQDPAAVSPFAFDGSPAWSSPALQGVQGFVDFAAILVLTDTAETGKVWIEQAGPLRGAAPMVIAASSQTGPLLHPYYQSGQINGLFTGLYDSAVIEQINAGRPGTARRYWDAYNIGLLLAVAFILGGGLFSLVTGLRERGGTRAG